MTINLSSTEVCRRHYLTLTPFTWNDFNNHHSINVQFLHMDIKVISKKGLFYVDFFLYYSFLKSLNLNVVILTQLPHSLMTHNRNFSLNIYFKPNYRWTTVLHKTEHFITNKDILLNKSMYSTKNFLKWDTIVDLLQFNGSVLICTLIKCKVK